MIAARIEDKDTLGADLRDVVGLPETWAAVDSDPDFASFSRPVWWTAENNELFADVHNFDASLR